MSQHIWGNDSLTNTQLQLHVTVHKDYGNHWAQLFKKFNLDQNDRDLKMPCFDIQDQVIHLTFESDFQSNIGLDLLY